MEHKYKYKVIEDNGGGLTLFVFWGRKAIYAHSGYEVTRGQLSADLDTLDTGAEVDAWEGAEEKPQALWDELDNFEYGWKIVAQGGGGKRKLFPAHMGTAACLEFGISDEQRQQSQVASRIGKITSPRKASTSAANGKQGGRPRKEKETE